MRTRVNGVGHIHKAQVAGAQTGQAGVVGSLPTKPIRLGLTQNVEDHAPLRVRILVDLLHDRFPPLQRHQKSRAQNLIRPMTLS